MDQQRGTDKRKLSSRKGANRELYCKVTWQVEAEEWQAAEKNFIIALTQIAAIAKKRTKIGVIIQESKLE
ncbi:44139_t:CDS:2 [Gigaspora margarita]|uniref:44139_t:CDS:1 n=1 Tax=Gigaspora margarita TaxID=4874 RepID=A0ABN7UIN9_GIGMA|nr:44139_t:CDS:2 [Gigaspora margarita]